jgi:hypothetical protein
MDKKYYIQPQMEAVEMAMREKIAVGSIDTNTDLNYVEELNEDDR